MEFSRRTLLGTALALPFTATSSRAADWSAIAAEGKGQTVYFNAWAGSETINAYIAWAGARVKELHGVTLEHVKVTDTAEVVRRVRDEVKAGTAKGSVDLVWINGENFRAMKSENLLAAPFATALPNFKFVDTKGKPTTLVDFAEPTDGRESPWGMAQLTFFGDGTKIGTPPQSMTELIDFAKANKGRVSYPAPPDFHGTTFVKQALVESLGDLAPLSKPAPKEIDAVTAPLFATLDALARRQAVSAKPGAVEADAGRRRIADGAYLQSQ
jgi:putative thiamine transport system substrate-binding protein